MKTSMLHLLSAVIMANTFIGCASLVQKLPKNEKLAPLHAVLIAERSKSHFVRIPPKGLMINDVLPVVPNLQTDPNPTEETDYVLQDPGNILNTHSSDLMTRLRELKSSVDRNSGATVISVYQDDVTKSQEKLLDALKSYSITKADRSTSSIDAKGLIDEYVKYMHGASNDFSFAEFLEKNSYVIQGPAKTDDTKLPQRRYPNDIKKFVRIQRPNGAEIVINTYHLRNNDLGSILLCGGDVIFIEDDVSLGSSNSEDNSPIVLSSPNFDPIEIPYLKGISVHDVWNGGYFERAGTYNSVITISRTLPSGRSRSFIIPLPLDLASNAFSPTIQMMKMHKLAPGDSVHVGTLELLPIVLGSKIISRRLQMAALQEEHELEQIDSYEKHERIKAFREKIQAKRHGTILGTSQRWVRSASNRLADGIDAIRDTVNLP